MESIDTILELFRTLIFTDKVLLLEKFNSIINSEQKVNDENKSILDQLVILQNDDNIIATKCPHCGGESISKWGKFQKRRRYLCNSCKRTFTSLTGTCDHAIKNKEKFKQYKEKMFSGNFSTISEMAKDIKINHQTAFDWRHKILASLANQTDNFAGITEIDDQWFLYSQKGRKGLKYARKRGGSSRRGDNNYQTKVLITQDRTGSLDLSVVRIGRLQSKDIKRKLKGRLNKSVLLISDAHPSIKSFANTEKIEHKSFKAKSHGIDSELHVQHVNNTATRFKNLVNNNLRGISTKYLQNYANWFKVKEQFKKVENKTEKIIQEIEKSVSAWSLHMNTENLYSTFIENRSIRTYRCPTKRNRKSQNWNLVNASETDWL